MPSPDPRSRVGAMGEDAALRRYQEAGYRLVARNWRCRLGEIDLVLARGSVLVVCEVKTRRGTGLGGPFEAVDRRKQEKLRALVQAFLGAEARSPAILGTTEIRFDVASVRLDARGRGAVHVFEDAF